MAIGDVLSTLIPYGKQLGEAIFPVGKQIGEQIGNILPTTSVESTKSNEKINEIAIEVIQKENIAPSIKLIIENTESLNEGVTETIQKEDTSSQNKPTIEREVIVIDESISEPNVPDVTEVIDEDIMDEPIAISEPSTKADKPSESFYSNIGVGERTNVKPNKKREIPTKEDKHQSYKPAKEANTSSGNKKPVKHKDNKKEDNKVKVKLKPIETIKIPKHVLNMFTKNN